MMICSSRSWKSVELPLFSSRPDALAAGSDTTKGSAALWDEVGTAGAFLEKSPAAGAPRPAAALGWPSPLLLLLLPPLLFGLDQDCSLDEDGFLPAGLPSSTDVAPPAPGPLREDMAGSTSMK
jgi:hypothetical protein